MLMLMLLAALTLSWATLDDPQVRQPPEPKWPSETYPEEPNRSGRPALYRYPTGVSLIGLGVPRSISAKEIDRYAHVLGLSEAQVENLAALYSAYARADFALRTKHETPLLRRSVKLRDEAAPNQPGLLGGEIGKSLLGDGERFAKRVAQHESAFFMQIETMLAESQLPQLMLVRHERQRKRDVALGYGVRGSSLDLQVVLDEFRKRGLDVLPAERDAFLAAMFAWDEAVVPLFRRRHRQMTKDLPVLCELGAQRAALFPRIRAGDAAAEAQALALRDEAGRRHRVIHRLALRICKLNQQHAVLIGHHLDPATAQALVDRVREESSPVVYPDPSDLTQFFDAATECSPDHADLAALRIVYDEAHAVIISAMQRRCDKWSEETYIRSGYGIDAYNVYHTAIRRRHDERLALSQTTIASIMAVLTDDERQSLQPALERFEARRDAILTAIENAGYADQPWPMPSQMRLRLATGRGRSHNR